MKKILPFLGSLLCLFVAKAQDNPIKITIKEIPNRLMLYAENQTQKDYDVQLSVKGTNFRQSKARPRYYRVPGASKVHVKTLILMRGKKPSYSFNISLKDSLSRRAVKMPFEKIKINPKKSITVYIPKNCQQCDSLISPLERGDFRYKSYILRENLDIRTQLQKSFGSRSIPVDSMVVPILNLGGKLYTNITSYAELESALEDDNY